MRTFLTTIGERAAATPTDRNRYVDLLRVAAIGMVVVGHWLVVAFTVRDGRLDGMNVLAAVEWAHWLTWVFQVMPIFFLVGGFANAASWSSHRRRGGDWAAWVHRRALRLLWPTTLFVAFGVAGAVVGRLVGIDPALLEDAGWFVAIMLWFLAVYLGVVAVAPPMLAAHRRWGWRVPALLALGVVGVDLLRFGLGIGWVGDLNYALVWVGIHQLGYFWRDGSLVDRDRVPWALAVGGGAALVLLTVAGPYPISMIGVPGAEIQNSAPPSLALAALAVAQTGALLALRRPAARWLERHRVWAVVVGANAVVMTLFLWHMVPVLAVAPLVHLTGAFPDLPVGSAAWLALRPVWLAALVVVFAPLVAVVGRWERPPAALLPQEGRGRSRRAAILVGLGVPAACAGIALFTVGGFFHVAGPVGLPFGSLAAYLAGVALVEAGGRRARHPDPR